MVIDENELAKISFNLKLNDISEIIEDTENNLYYIYLEKVNKSKVKSLETVKDDIVNLLYDDERKRVAKNAAENFKKNYLNNKNLEKNSKKFFYSELTDWITLDNRLGKKIDYNLKKLIFSTKINSLSKIISTKDKKFVIALPIEQSDRILSEDQKSDFNDTMTEINNSLEGDLSNAILNDLNKLYTSNINQKFLESF